MQDITEAQANAIWKRVVSGDNQEHTDASWTRRRVNEAIRNGDKRLARQHLSEWLADHPVPVRRSTNEIAAARDFILQTAGDWTRLTTSKASDVAALVKQGKLEKNIRKHYDSGTGFQSHHFGGAAAMVRKVAWYKVADNG